MRKEQPAPSPSHSLHEPNSSLQKQVFDAWIHLRSRSNGLISPLDATRQVARTAGVPEWFVRLAVKEMSAQLLASHA